MATLLSGLGALLMWLPFGITGWVGYGIDVLRQVDLPIPEPGIVYSAKQAESFGLSPTSTYLAVLDELKPPYLRLIAYWDRIEREPGEYDFKELDYLMTEAKKRDVKTTLIIGRKVPRWPECHSPKWVSLLPQDEQERALERFLTAIVEHYRHSPSLEYWQVENELFFKFGDCAKPSGQQFQAELKLVRSLDPSHPIVVTSSGEMSTWLRSFTYGDVIGISMYHEAVFRTRWFTFRIGYPLPPLFYGYKAKLMGWLFHKPLMVTELQLEPWFDTETVLVPLADQTKVMPLAQFQEVIQFAGQTRINRVYLWGVEWWYWLKQNGMMSYWDYVKQAVF